MTNQVSLILFGTLMARFSLSVFLISSAIGKISDLKGFVQGVINYKVLPPRMAVISAYTLPWIELCIGIGLLIGMSVSPLSILAILLFFSFTVAIVLNLRRGRLIPCYCHGIAGVKTISWGIAVRNALLLILAILPAVFGVNSTHTQEWLTIWPDNKVYVLMIILSVACLIAIIQLVEHSVESYVKTRNLTQRGL